MNVLAIGCVWTGMKSFFYEGEERSNGMPAFYNVFIRLLNDPRIDTIYLLLLTTKQQVKIPAKYKDKLVVYPYPYDHTNKIHALFVFLKILFRGLVIVKSKGIQRLIGFGPEAGLTAILGKLTGIPDFRRLYGSFLINEIDTPWFKLFLKHPLEYLSLAVKGKGLLITNDGTKGDLVFEKFGNKKMPFHFLLNGVDLDLKDKTTPPDFQLPDRYLSYVARVEPWKSQHLLIDALGVLKAENYDFPPLYIVGNLQDKSYISLLKEKTQKHGLADKVFFMNGLPITQAHYVLQYSAITYSLYHTSNLGNVFLESMRLGAVMIALNDTGSLNVVDKRAFCEILSNDPVTIAHSTKKILADSSLRSDIANNAVSTAERILQDWSTRANHEINLILSHD